MIPTQIYPLKTRRLILPLKLVELVWFRGVFWMMKDAVEYKLFNRCYQSMAMSRQNGFTVNMPFSFQRCMRKQHDAIGMNSAGIRWRERFSRCPVTIDYRSQHVAWSLLMRFDHRVTESYVFDYYWYMNINDRVSMMSSHITHATLKEP